MSYRRARNTAWRAIADETIVLDLAAKRMYGLNPTGGFIWQTLETMPDLADLRRALGAGSGGSRLAAADLDRFLEELLAAGLIEPGEPEKPAPVAIEPPADAAPPRIAWQETIEQVAMSCAFFPAQNPLCNQVPFS